MKKIAGSLFFLGVLVLASGALIAPLTGQEANDETGEDESKFDYTVVDGRVDEGVAMGYQVYTGSCMPCHGPDGLGSAFAPSLLRAAERRTFEDFAQTIAEGRDVLPGQVMPSFADDVRVMSHVQDIWNYLGARAEGELGRGRPQPLEEEDDDEG